MSSSLKELAGLAMAKILPAKKAAEIEPPKKNAPGADNGLVTLIAHHRPLVNTQILTCYLPGTDSTDPRNLVTVRVGSNLNFLPGMELRAHVVRRGIYDLYGPLPRGRGRW